MHWFSLGVQDLSFGVLAFCRRTLSLNTPSHGTIGYVCALMGISYLHEVALLILTLSHGYGWGFYLSS